MSQQLNNFMLVLIEQEKQQTQRGIWKYDFICQSLIYFIIMILLNLIQNIVKWHQQFR